MIDKDADADDMMMSGGSIVKCNATTDTKVPATTINTYIYIYIYIHIYIYIYTHTHTQNLSI